jgi:uncharacterized protein YgbK (DUF1537 family)
MSVLATAERDEPRAVRRVAVEARRIIEGEGIDLVVVTGGETALALLEALGADHVDLVGAPGAGLALSHVCAPGHSRLAVLTKAGGFGSDGLFVTLAEEAMGEESSR